MPELLAIWNNVLHWLPALLVGLHFVFFCGTIVWILMTKTESQSAVAWCLIVILVPYWGRCFSCSSATSTCIGRCGANGLHMERYRQTCCRDSDWRCRRPDDAECGPVLNDEPLLALQHLADRVGAFPLTFGNQVDFYYDGNDRLRRQARGDPLGPASYPSRVLHRSAR